MSYCPNCGKEIKDIQPVSNNEKTTEQDTNVSPKNRLLAMLLGIFCGFVGVHNFYLGRKKEGLVQAILYGVALNLICAFYIIFFVFVVKNTFTTASRASVFIFLAVFYILLFSAIGMLYYCIISSLVQWIKIARGLTYDGNGLPVKNWNFK